MAPAEPALEYPSTVARGGSFVSGDEGRRPLDARVGLCAVCAHAKRITSAKGSTFWLCGKAESDPRFPKYPRLPVLRGPAYQPKDDGPS